jgi:hypothetical protein
MEFMHVDTNKWWARTIRTHLYVVPTIGTHVESREPIGTHLYMDTNYRDTFKFSRTIGTHLNSVELSEHIFNVMN